MNYATASLHYNKSLCIGKILKLKKSHNTSFKVFWSKATPGPSVQIGWKQEQPKNRGSGRSHSSAYSTWILSYL